MRRSGPTGQRLEECAAVERVADRRKEPALCRKVRTASHAAIRRWRMALNSQRR